MDIKIPKLSLVVLIGASSAGKSTLARRLFKDTEIISSDACRAMVSDDENNMDATKDAFELLHFMVETRLRRGLLTVVDATSARIEDRAKLVALAKKYYVMPVAIVLNLPLKICAERNRERADRNIPFEIIANFVTLVKRAGRNLKEEGFKRVFEYRNQEQVDNIQRVFRERMFTDRSDITGPFDIIGDVHGCYDELCLLLEKLDYKIDKANYCLMENNGRTLLFVGDLVDRGPNSAGVLRFVMNAVEAGQALTVVGNHDNKLMRWLNGKKVEVKNGLECTVKEMEAESAEFKHKVEKFIFEMASHYVLDEGRLVIAHAGIRASMIGRASAGIRDYCMYGETNGEVDEFGLPVRLNWATNYKGKAMVVFGHTPIYEPQWFNNTIDIDTGCVFGHKLTALRYPSKEIVQVNALATYAVSKRPIEKPAVSMQHEHDALLDIDTVLGKQLISSRLMDTITIREGNVAAGFETMSLFGIDPKWLIYLPPTMSPAETSSLPGYLEYPTEAFSYYKEHGIEKVICEEKHMGSRAVVIVCKDVAAAEAKFGVGDGKMGVCYTRTGRAFFGDEALEQAFIRNIAGVLTERGFWDEFHTEWVCLDAELMPWSAKAQGLIQHQYAGTGSAAKNALHAVNKVLSNVKDIPGIEQLQATFTARESMANQFVEAYGRYCWEVQSLADYTLAPFHLLATEKQTYFDKDHVWHMETLQKYCGGEGNVMQATAYKIVDFADPASEAIATEWWLALTAAGGEGMVVKPMQFIHRGERGLVQPAIKIRGIEYLRIIYGLGYTEAAQLERLKQRGLNTKRGLALREFSLGVEALERFVAGERLTSVHQCVTAILALESEPVDPRL
ncbi:polynucleotide kinase-phosphatase [Chitinophaga skermanii]|uniref:Polynucleotide kinase-phosphatase n=1 Tax=Chitinophaga skermanii TaxID=331697 RepID=A0A327QWI7_9BACT|nr:polynucleotide kinase-phosphatase [Chitinophaga skermanii]RAJ08720.1 polynucleotide kinase-phosphatase [Chitinophaga skermanii]